MLTQRFQFATVAIAAGLFSLTACAILAAPSPSTERPETAIFPDSKPAISENLNGTPKTIEMGRDLSQEGASALGESYHPPTLLPTVQRQTDPAPAPDLSPTTVLNIRPTYEKFFGDTDSYFVSGFACTGSMRPALDCGDEAVFLKPPFPAPLAVGDVVSFSVDIACRYYKSQDIAKAHRIIDIGYEGIRPLYTTQGDASSNPDPCEVTLDQVDGLLVEVRKGVRPQDIIDASEYDIAKLAVTQLKDEYYRQLDLYEVEKAAYEALVEEYNSLVEHYQRGDVSYQVVSEFYESLEERRTSLNARRQGLNELSDRINLAIDEVDRLYQLLFVG